MIDQPRKTGMKTSIGCAFVLTLAAALATSPAPAAASGEWCDGKPATITQPQSEGVTILGGQLHWEHVYTATSGDDVIVGSWADTKHGLPLLEKFFGGGGDDTICGRSGVDWIFGDAGRDRLFGGHGDDLIRGAGGNDYLSGGLHDDSVHGGSGNDIVRGEQHNDHVTGGPGNDWLIGTWGHDHLWAEDGDVDHLIPNAGNDFCDIDPGDVLHPDSPPECTVR